MTSTWRYATSWDEIAQLYVSLSLRSTKLNVCTTSSKCINILIELQNVDKLILAYMCVYFVSYKALFLGVLCLLVAHLWYSPTMLLRRSLLYCLETSSKRLLSGAKVLMLLLASFTVGLFLSHAIYTESIKQHSRDFVLGKLRQISAYNSGTEDHLNRWTAAWHATSIVMFVSMSSSQEWMEMHLAIPNIFFYGAPSVLAQIPAKHRWASLHTVSLSDVLDSHPLIQISICLTYRMKRADLKAVLHMCYVCKSAL